MDHILQNNVNVKLSDLVSLSTSVNRRIERRFIKHPEHKFHGHAWVQYKGMPFPTLQMINQDYLGVSMSDDLRAKLIAFLCQNGYGRSSNILYGGTSVVHEELEKIICQMFHTEMTIITPSCADANMSSINTFCPAGSYIISDESVHNSIVDGCRLSKATKLIFKHNDMNDLKIKLRLVPMMTKKMILCDGIYSMDAEACNLPEILKLADIYNANIYIDDAHATGVIGPNSLGTADYFGIDLATHKNIIIASAFSKAIQSTGGFITGSRALLKCIPYDSSLICHGAPVGVSAVAALHMFQLIKAGVQDRLVQLNDNIKRLKSGLKNIDLEVIHHVGPFVVIMLRNLYDTFMFTEILFQSGLHVAPAVFPIVPKNKATIRLMITAGMTSDDIDFAISCFVKVVDILHDDIKSSFYSYVDPVNIKVE
ncbi:MAG: pyridoxal phosphate-dependent aminotransferase family protein [Candidatus Aenigmarchaeota archaeon]|nr:pyridoxal phosphate-dependent aminotransferase family protein [Candidatus Aenigmarchaeota archaeon]